MSRGGAQEIAARLRKSGVAVAVVNDSETRVMVDRFVDAFVDLKKQETTRLRVHRSMVKHTPLEYESLLRPEQTSDATAATGQFDWLSAGGRFPQCYFFDRRAYRQALRIEIATLDEKLATSWPGVFVNFDARRALAVTPDLFRFRCDLGSVRSIGRA